MRSTDEIRADADYIGGLDWVTQYAVVEPFHRLAADVPSLLAEVERLTAERDTARAIACQLEQQLAAVTPMLVDAAIDTALDGAK